MSASCALTLCASASPSADIMKGPPCAAACRSLDEPAWLSVLRSGARTVVGLPAQSTAVASDGVMLIERGALSCCAGRASDANCLAMGESVGELCSDVSAMPLSKPAALDAARAPEPLRVASPTCDPGSHLFKLVLCAGGNLSRRPVLSLSDGGGAEGAPSPSLSIPLGGAAVAARLPCCQPRNLATPVLAAAGEAPCWAAPCGRVGLRGGLAFGGALG